MDIDNIRKATGTLPSCDVATNYEVVRFGFPGVEVDLVDWPANPYRSMFSTATATWGDNKYEDKWLITSPINRYEVIKAVLSHNTLPQAREMLNFVFRVRGTPRWLFDAHTQVKFTTFMSIGCRDNNKADCSFVIYPELFFEETEDVLRELKDHYVSVIKEGKESWQTARAFLPLCYQHSYHFGQNLLSMASMKFASDITGITLRHLYYYVRKAVGSKFPLLEEYLAHCEREEKWEPSNFPYHSILQDDLDYIEGA